MLYAANEASTTSKCEFYKLNKDTTVNFPWLKALPKFQAM